MNFSRTPKPIDRWLWIALLTAFVLLVVSLLAGCASNARVSKTTHTVEVTTTTIPVTNADGATTMVPVTTKRELWQDEATHEERTSGPDVERIAAAAAAVAPVVVSAGTGMGTGQIIGGALALATATASAWFARGRETKVKDQQLAEKDERLERLRLDRDAHQKRAETYARQLPPTTFPGA